MNNPFYCLIFENTLDSRCLCISSSFSNYYCLTVPYRCQSGNWMNYIHSGSAFHKVNGHIIPNMCVRLQRNILKNTLIKVKFSMQIYYTHNILVFLSVYLSVYLSVSLFVIVSLWLFFLFWFV